MPLKELGKDERKPLSKLGVDSIQKLLQQKKAIPGDTGSVVLEKKKIAATFISQLKKLREYEGVAGNAKAKINIKVAFSVLNILD